MGAPATAGPTAPASTGTGRFKDDEQPSGDRRPRGRRPASNERGRPLLGDAEREIYSYVELRAELETLGRPLTTTSDTEVIAQAYAEWGPACLDRMNGDFAFAAWDRREQELFLARDRFGVRPLFLAELGGDLVFASEQKAILRHPAARRELDPAGLVESFTTWCISPDASSFPGIRELAPAHFLRAGPEGIREAALVGPPLFGRARRPACGEPPSPRSSTPFSPTPRACACAPTSPSPPT